MSSDDLEEISNIQRSKPSLTEQDCSAFYLAGQLKGTLITSDNTLRKFAKVMKQDVHGHLWVFDKMVATGILSGIEAGEKLDELCNNVNPKLGLPESECRRRKVKWED